MNLDVCHRCVWLREWERYRSELGWDVQQGRQPCDFRAQHLTPRFVAPVLRYRTALPQ